MPDDARRLPRWSELRPLIRRRSFEPSPVRRRLARALTVADLRAAARRQVPRAVFDYVDGAAEAEISLARARTAYRNVEFVPRVLRDVGDVDTTTEVLGRTSALPLVLAPTGFTRLLHHQGEVAVARAAVRAGIPYALSTMGTTSVEDLTAAVPSANLWFQLYLWRDRAASLDLVKRAAAAGITTLVLTVDTPVGGARLRDIRNGFTIPPQLTPRTLAGLASRPAWWANLLTTRPLEFASLRSSGGTVEALIARMFDPCVTLDDLTWLRSQWDGTLMVKGVQCVADALEVVDRGAEAVLVSNHGGRQLDRAPTPLDVLGPVVDAVGDRAEVFVDTGIMSGGDLVVARALGATAGVVGRAYLYGLMAGGEPGVDRAIEILRQELIRTMQLLGVERVPDLTREHVRRITR
jgi:L-lactate dehydrogenase (cytochrome)